MSTNPQSRSDSSDEEEKDDDGPVGFKRKRRQSDSENVKRPIKFDLNEVSNSTKETTVTLTNKEKVKGVLGSVRDAAAVGNTNGTNKAAKSNFALSFQSALSVTDATDAIHETISSSSDIDSDRPSAVKIPIKFDLDEVSNSTKETIVKLTNKTKVKGVVLGSVRDAAAAGSSNGANKAAKSNFALSFQSALSDTDAMDAIQTISSSSDIDSDLPIPALTSLVSTKPKPVLGNGVAPKHTYFKEVKVVIPKTETGRIDWDCTYDDVVIEEVIDWIQPQVPEPLDMRLLISWRKLGAKKDNYEGSTPFISKEIMTQILESKTNMHKVEGMVRLEARVKSNPFEMIRAGIFMNRAAMKMANIDATLGFALTQPQNAVREPLVEGNDLLYFADVCAGPGGFSEYILWRKKWEAKGFGFTLKGGENDFELDSFIAGPPESFETHYGREGDGNVLNPANTSAFVQYVLSCTEQKGVHFMMADGGFDVDGIEDKQEIVSKSLILAQFFVGLAIVRPGGHFICKMFDAFTHFSVGLIYIMYRSFDLVAIHKPNTSRPANSERYIICKWKREDTEGVRDYLYDCHDMLWNWSAKPKHGKESRDIIELIDVDLLTKEGHPFFKYIYKSNNSWGARQIRALNKLTAFCSHPALLETRQKDIRASCLELWGVPNEKRTLEPPELPSTRFAIIKGTYPPGLLTDVEKDLTTSVLEQTIKSPYDWRFVVIEGDQKRRNRGFYFGMGGSRVYRFNDFIWSEVGFKFELSKDTCVFGEIVHEYCKQTKSTTVAFHIIDALMLGGKDVRNCHYTLRHELCSKFAKAMDKPSRPDLIRVRVKNLMKMENLAEIFEKLTYRETKAGKEETSHSSKLACPIDLNNEESDLMCPSGILFLKITKDPWIMALSRSANRKYWFNTMTSSSVFSIPESAVADFQYTVKNRIVWWWDMHTRVSLINTLLDNPAIGQPNGKVHAGPMVQYIRSLTQTNSTR